MPEDPRLAVTFTIDMGTHADVAGAVVQAAADRLLSTYYVDPDGDPVSRPSPLARQLEKKIDDGITTYVQEHLAEHLDALLTREMPERDSYGDIKPGGVKKTLAEMIHDRLKQEMIDRPMNTGSGFARDRPASVMHKVVAEVTDRVLADELKKEIAAAKLEVRKKLQQRAATVLADDVARSLRA